MFAALGVDLAAVSSARRPLLRFRLEWSEQRHHLAEALGAAVTSSFLDAGWLRRRARAHRAVRLTDSGRAALGEVLGL